MAFFGVLGIFSSLEGINYPPPSLYNHETPEMAEDQTGMDIGQLVAEHHRVLFAYAYRLTGAVPDAEDLTQQTFLSQLKYDCGRKRQVYKSKERLLRNPR